MDFLLAAVLFCAYNCNLFSYNWNFLAYSGKVLLMSTSTDCKQIDSLVSKQLPLQAKKLVPLKKEWIQARNLTRIEHSPGGPPNLVLGLGT